jgi:hypothetical protein
VQEVIHAVLEYSRGKAFFNLVTNICHTITKSCPRSTNSTASEVCTFEHFVVLILLQKQEQHYN